MLNASVKNVYLTTLSISSLAEVDPVVSVHPWLSSRHH